MTGVGRAVAANHPVKERVGFGLAKVCKAHRGNVAGLLAEFGLHVGQEMVLIELWQNDGLRGGELACRLGVEPPTVTKMLRRLEGMGLIERRPDPADARSFRVYLTGPGRALEEPVLGCWERAEEKTFAGLDPAERREFGRLLAKVRSGLGSIRD
ncbi:MarR family transcriptional regulator [Rubrobacter tropicus]|uniref:MarR family transcriptional regulator n=1 Tax=Rubrobacter tropicus TaxID=2653851 RepID=A0A6G8Q7X5_9ACTN|nr:MarR family transcriptional regulator [Rubrobacter tropicus]QIN82570.1 MarR family transcriptional regulator [Rubrobacter tropicus]